MMTNMAPFIFICPVTQMRVQHWRDDAPGVSEDEYETVACRACTRIHLVNRKTGKLLGQIDR